MKPKNPETGTIYARAELLDAFNIVADKEHWKRPINTLVSLDAALLEKIATAVEFYTGARPDMVVVMVEGYAELQVRVTAPGYYATVGA